jgi:hypothetical protein
MKKNIKKFNIKELIISLIEIKISDYKYGKLLATLI